MSLQERIDKVYAEVATSFDLRSAFLTHPFYIAGDPADDTDDDEEEEEEEEEESGKDSGASGTGSGSADDKEVKDPEKKRLSEEAAKYRRLRREERQAREAAEAKLREHEDKDKDESTKLKGQLETVTKERDELKATVGTFARELAVSRAARQHGVTDTDLLEFFLSKEKVEYLDEDGEIADISDVVADLVKKKPQLVSSGSSKDEEEDQPSGRQFNGKKDKSKSLDMETLAKKFPALRR